jgi:hypothetical protein
MFYKILMVLGTTVHCISQIESLLLPNKALLKKKIQRRQDVDIRPLNLLPLSIVSGFLLVSSK